MRPLLVSIVFACAAAASVVGAESGAGSLGDWALVWRFESGIEVNRFRAEMGDSVPFPFRSRIVRDASSGDRIVLLDPDGNSEEEFSLDPGEQIRVAHDAASWLRWSRDPVRGGLSQFRYFRRGDPEPVWEAMADGEPVLFAPDGSLFVLTSEDSSRDLYQRVSLERTGRTQLVGAGGEVRAELPVRPIFASLTGDEGHLVLFVDNELFVLTREGTLAWTAKLPIDQLIARDGHGLLQAKGGRIAIAGTGEKEPVGSSAWSVHPNRVGRIRVLDEAGRLLWKADQPEDEPLWFQITPCLSEDGTALVTVHSEASDVIVRAWDMETGEPIWMRRESRHAGVRNVSMTPDGQFVAVTHGEIRTRVKVWDREGDLVWEGTVPYSSRTPELATGGLLVAERWIVKLVLAEDDGA